jgi:putative ABC transport system permease protein
MRGQALAIALVIAAGVCVHVIIAGMLASLEETQRAYYERYRFADIWAGTVRAPESLGEEIRAIEGVAAAETRLMAPILFDMEDMAAPASGVIHSLPRGREPTVSHIHLSEGRMPDPERRDEAVVLDSFAAAHELQIGDRLSVTIRGRQESLRITGKALTPEYIYAVAPGPFIPDARLFGVLWMDRRALERAADLDGAFNLVALRLMRGADAAPVIDELDRLLDPMARRAPMNAASMSATPSCRASSINCAPWATCCRPSSSRWRPSW